MVSANCSPSATRITYARLRMNCVQRYALISSQRSAEPAITQKQIAALLGVSKARVSQIEHGQVGRAAIRGLGGYVEALGGHLELVADFGDERLVIG